MKKDSKIYIAGHTGLVGSAIMKNLLQKKFTHIIGKQEKELDLRDTIAVKRFFEKERPEYVFLAAAKVGGIHANNVYRAEFIYDNLMIQNNIIHNSFLYGVKKLLFLGSTCIYPKNCPQPMKEEYLLTGELEYTNEPYAIAKIAGLKMCESYNLQYNTNFLCVMPTNLYGYNDNFDLEKGHVLPALLRKIFLARLLEEHNFQEIIKDITGSKNPLDKQEYSNPENILSVLNKYGIKKKNNEVTVEIWGSGNPLREFMWSDDMADACVFIMENVNFSDLIKTKKEIKNTHINIGTGKEISIKQLAFLIKEIIGFKGNFYFNKEKPDGTLRKLTDTTKLNNLGWKHKIEMEQGIKMLFEWYKNKI